MTVEHAIIRADTPASTGPVSYQDSAITDWKLALFYLSDNTADSTFQAHGKLLVGACASDGTQFAQTSRSTDAQTIRQHCVGSSHSDDCIALQMDDGSAGNPVLATFSAALSDGVTVNYTATLSGLKLTIVLLGGDLNATCGADVLSGSPTTVTVGFEADVLFTTGDLGAADSAHNDVRMSCGFCLNDLTQMSVSMFLEHNVTPLTEAVGIMRPAHVACLEFGAQSLFGEVVSVDATSFDVDRSAEVSSLRLSWAAIEFTDADDSAALVQETIDGTTGVVAYTGMGMRPSVVFALGTQLTVDDTADATGLSGSLSVSVFDDGNAEYAHGMSHEVGITVGVGDPTVAKSYTNVTAFQILDDDGTLHNVGTFSAMTATGFNLTMTGAGSGSMIALGIISGIPPVAADLSATATASAGTALGTSVAMSADASVEAVTYSVTAQYPLVTEPRGNIAQAGLKRGNAASASFTGNIAQGGLKRGNVARAKVGDGNIA